MTDKEVALAELRKHWTLTEEHIMELEREIEAEAAPALRHGDYGKYEKGSLWLVLKRDGVLELFGSDCGSGIPAAAALANSKHTKLGNFFDDLKSISEPLDSFTLDLGTTRTVKCQFSGDRICIEQEPHNFYIPIANFPDFILNLRRMEYGLREKSVE